MHSSTWFFLETREEPLWLTLTAKANFLFKINSVLIRTFRHPGTYQKIDLNWLDSYKFLFLYLVGVKPEQYFITNFKKTLTSK